MSSHKRKVIEDNDRLRELLADARTALATACKEERERCAKVADAQREEYESYSVTEWQAGNDEASLQFDSKADAIVKIAAAIRAMENDNG